MNFDEIELTAREYHLLRALYDASAAKMIVYDKSIADAVSRLLRLEFAALRFILSDDTINVTAPKGVVITDLGTDYYIYLQRKKQEKHRAFRRDLLCVLIGAAATLLLEHLLPLLAAVLHSIVE